MRKQPILYIVIPCYNEEKVLPITSGMFLEKINTLAAAGKISPESRVLFVNDGSKDNTWNIITELAAKDEHYIGEGNAHVVSPSRAMEAGGDQMDYYGKEQGKAVITGNAWAVQENNTMRSNRMTIYLADDGSAKVQ